MVSLKTHHQQIWCLLRRSIIGTFLLFSLSFIPVSAQEIVDENPEDMAQTLLSTEITPRPVDDNIVEEIHSQAVDERRNPITLQSTQEEVGLNRSGDIVEQAVLSTQDPTPPLIDNTGVQKKDHQGQSLTQIIRRRDDDLLIFSLNLGNRQIQDVLLVYEDLETQKYYVPFSDFVDALEFPIDVDDDKGKASGWFIDESYDFTLDLSRASAKARGKKYDLSVGDIESHDDGIYVSLEQLQQWFPITLDVDFSQLAIVVKSLEPLPIEIRAARDESRESVSRRGDVVEKEYPLVTEKAPAFTLPFINVSAQAKVDRGDNVDKTLSANSSLVASGIFAGHDLIMSANKDTATSEPVDIRLSLGMQDSESRLLGLGVGEYKVGDVNTNAIPFVASGAAGRGVFISSQANGLGTGSQSGTVQLRGELQVGYQVDIMRNGQLLDFIEQPDANGEYVFDVSVLPGLNIFELVFYGPQGQKDTQEERIYVAANPIKKGAFDFKTSLIQGNTNLFTNREQVGDKDQGEYRFSGEASYGLTDNSSAYIAAADVSLDGQRKQYGLARYSYAFKGVRSDVSYAVSDDGGQAAGLRLQSVFRGISWQIQHDYYNQFISEQTQQLGAGDDLNHATNIRVSGLLPFINAVPFSFNLDHLLDDEGDRAVSWQGRLTKNVKKIRLTSTVSQSIRTDQDRETDLSVQISSRYDNISVRGNFSYGVEPDLILNTVSFNTDWRINNNSVASLGLRRSGGNDPVHALTLGYSRKFDKFKLGVDLSYDDNDNLSAVLGTSFGLGYIPGERKTIMGHRPLAHTSVLNASVYYDKNYNAVYDDGDEALEGVGFYAAGITGDDITDGEGRLSLVRLPSYEDNIIHLDMLTLPDPYMRSVLPTQRYVMRPSQVMTQEFPIILVGEVDGNVSLVKNGGSRAAPAIEINISKVGSDAVVAMAKTEYDGFGWVKDVPMGDYDLHINREQLEKLGYCSPQRQSIALQEGEPFTSFDDIFLWPSQTEKNQVISLFRHDDKNEVIKAWQKLRDPIAEIMSLSDQMPHAYLVSTSDGESYELILMGVLSTEKEMLCEDIPDGNCVPYDIDARCPQLFIPIEQINNVPTSTISSDVGEGEATERSLDGAFEDNIRENLTESDVINIIDN